jgi:hypothetical protein
MLYLANISSNGNSSLGHSIVGAIAIDVNLPDFITIINHPSLRRVFPPPPGLMLGYKPTSKG